MQMYLIRTISFILFLLGLTQAVGQDNTSELHFGVLAGESISFELQSIWGDPTVAFAPDHGFIEEEPSGSNVYTISYSANTGYHGEDVFSIQTLLPGNFGFPQPHLTVVYLDVKISDIKALDDFIEMEALSVVELYPLENDASNTNSHNLKGIGHVQYGSAIATDSNTIIYTPGPAKMDFVQYTIEDSLGVSSSATYYIKETAANASYTLEQITTSTTDAQYIFLRSVDYALTNAPILGNVSSVADGVVQYTSTTAGVDSLVFEDSDGNIAEVHVAVFQSATDEGVVRDDQVFTTMNKEVVFNVFENDFDNSLVVDEQNTSTEITYLGSGQFSYMPAEDFSGVKTFYYTATNSFVTESGTITIVVNNFSPASSETYEFTVLEGSVLSLPYAAPTAEYYFDVVSSPVYGEISYFDGVGSVVTECGNVDSDIALIYTPYADFVGVDEFEVNYCPDEDLNDCELLKVSVNVTANPEMLCNCVDDCVWRGDANNDGVVDILDVLTVGRSVGSTGASRTDAAPWEGTTSADWLGSTNYGINHKYADTDGSGFVTADDVQQVIDNYSNSHSFIRNNVLAVKDYPFYLVPKSTGVEPGDLMSFDIVMGSVDYPVIDLQGVAFAVNLSADFVDSSTVEVTYLANRYLVKSSPFIQATHQPVDGQIHTAGIKSNQSTSNGYGVFATLEFIVEDEVEGVKVPQKMRSANGRNYYDVDVVLENIVISDGGGHLFAVQPTSSTFEVEVQQPVANDEAANALLLYPNPAANIIGLDAPSSITEVQLTDVFGKVVFSRKYQGGAASLSIDVSAIPTGSYVANVLTADTSYSKRVAIAK